MKRLCRYILLLAAVMISSCGGKNGMDPECVEASEAAAEYYSYLLEGRNEDFVNSFARTDSLPGDYKKALLENIGDFAEVQKKRYGGIKAADYFKAVRDTANGTVNVFLTLTYGDSTQTSVVVPMIKKNDKWFMK